MRLLRTVMTGLLRLPALLVPLALVAAMAIPIAVLEVSPAHTPAATVLANVTYADVVSIALAAVLIAVVLLTFAVALQFVARLLRPSTTADPDARAALSRWLLERPPGSQLRTVATSTA